MNRLSVSCWLGMALLSLACPAWAQEAKRDQKAEQKTDAKAPEMAPLTPEQHTRIRDLVQSTQARNAELNSALAVKQRELAAAYESFELDVSRVERLQTEIVELQRQLLANYHRLQVELRAAVGPERFAVLSARINNALRTPPKRPAAEAPKGEAPPRERTPPGN